MTVIIKFIIIRLDLEYEVEILCIAYKYIG